MEVGMGGLRAVYLGGDGVADAGVPKCVWWMRNEVTSVYKILWGSRDHAPH